MAIRSISISGFVYEDKDFNGKRASTLIQGTDPDVVFVLDNSGSTWSDFSGKVKVGDLNNDVYENTILDAEISAVSALTTALIAQGFARSDFSVISLNDIAVTVFDGLVGDRAPFGRGNAAGVAAKSIQYGGLTNYEVGLSAAFDYLNDVGSSSGNIIFLSDGFPNSGQEGITIANDIKAAGHNLQAFGVGAGASAAALDTIDSDGKSYTFNDPDELKSVLSGKLSGAVLSSVSYTEPGLAGVTIYLDVNDNEQFDSGVDLSAITDSDGNYTITGAVADGTYALREVVPTDSIPNEDYQQFETPGFLTVSANKTVFDNFNFGNALRSIYVLNISFKKPRQTARTLPTVGAGMKSSDTLANNIRMEDRTFFDYNNLAGPILKDDPINRNESTFIGTSGDDLQEGYAGADILSGLDGNDTLKGGNGHDFIDGGSGADIMYGGKGGNTFSNNEDGEVDELYIRTGQFDPTKPDLFVDKIDTLDPFDKIIFQTTAFGTVSVQQGQGGLEAYLDGILEVRYTGSGLTSADLQAMITQQIA